MAPVPDTISASQLVAHNLTRIRKALGLSQDQAAARLEPYLGVRWSKAVYSAAERSYSGKRIRQFTAAELAAFALAFGVPVLYFFLPPRPDDREADGVMVGNQYLAWPDLFRIMAGGEARNAFPLRLDELPVSEVEPGAHALVASGLSSWVRIDRAGNASQYDATAGRFRPAAANPVVAAVVTSDQGVLIARRNDGVPPWTFVAGEMEPGERPWDTAIREVKEEAGLEVTAGEVIGERVHPATGRVMVYIEARPVRGTEVFVGDEAELAEVRWVGLAEADELLTGMFAPVREHLVREIGGQR